MESTSHDLYLRQSELSERRLQQSCTSDILKVVKRCIQRSDKGDIEHALENEEEAAEAAH